MTESEFKTLQDVIRRLSSLAARLDTTGYGEKPITKNEASVMCYGLKADLIAMLDRRSQLFSN